MAAGEKLKVREHVKSWLKIPKENIATGEYNECVINEDNGNYGW